jgi:hypothetical protein
MTALVQPAAEHCHLCTADLASFAEPSRVHLHVTHFTTGTCCSEPVQDLPKGALPPFNGYGTLDDSKQNCTSLVPKPPKRDMHKLMNKDKIILRFTSKMAETESNKLSQSDAERVFVLSYFLMDDTLSIFEPPVRNSGIAGGKFLERSKVWIKLLTHCAVTIVNAKQPLSLLFS